MPRLNKGIQLCRDVGDNGSEELLTYILVESEKHVDWLESQLELVKQVGDAHTLPSRFAIASGRRIVRWRLGPQPGLENEVHYP